MRLVSLKVENFRCYGDSCRIFFNDLTAIVGQNDVGKISPIGRTFDIL